MRELEYKIKVSNHSEEGMVIVILTEKGRQTKEKILDSALIIFSKKGFNGATTKEIAFYAGIAEGTLFRYFPSKKALLFSILEPLAFNTLTDFWPEAEKKSLPDLLEFIVRDRMKLLRDNWDLFKVLLQEVSIHQELKEQLIDNVVIPVQKKILPIIQKKMELGEIRNTNPFYVFQTFLGMIFSIIVMQILKNEIPGVSNLEEDEMIKEIITNICQGVGVNG